MVGEALPPIGVRPALARWKENLRLLNRTPRTRARYSDSIDKFANWLEMHHPAVAGDLGRAELAHLRAFVATLFGRYEPNNLAGEISILRTFFRFLVRDNLIVSSPAERMERPKLVKTLPRALSLREADLLVAAPSIMGGPQAARDRAILELFYGSGLRLAELAGADRGDLNLDDQTILVRGKGQKERLVPVSLGFAEAWRDWEPERARLVDRRDPQAPLFPSPRQPRLSIATIEKMVRRYGEAALKKRVTPHMLRHSFATHLVAGGMDLRSVQHLMGHSSLISTERYLSVDLTRIQQVYRLAYARARERAGDEISRRLQAAEAREQYDSMQKKPPEKRRLK